MQCVDFLSQNAIDETSRFSIHLKAATGVSLRVRRSDACSRMRRSSNMELYASVLRRFPGYVVSISVGVALKTLSRIVDAGILMGGMIQTTRRVPGTYCARCDCKTPHRHERVAVHGAQVAKRVCLVCNPEQAREGSAEVTQRLD